MRVIGCVAAIASAMALVGCGEGATSSAQASGGEAQGQKVVAVGCPKTPQPGCVTMASGGKAYDVSDAGIDLTRGVAVAVTGLAAGEVTACGPKLTSVEVEYQGLQCAAPAPAAAEG
ncbi:hypothetical protein [Phenylobacterium sp. J367]|uniref:hypothetical protein n=1 Tax=Phenylobacterium sp. J367 TaxID=2898435 RepID=UPI002150E03F|nr:hypothetical protein [Phenylobacterium sp. J367]MCR5880797.1 hypothetical protein [Phenylobacterium sp. J367]